ncbi:unnamed protein product [Schistocephalus solidus]|uniref:Knl1_RWD_C domain-containing protein n=1 Tax=Schistocephalus solidus TaxID=70667 RepID=A0A183STK4_SCHSO|nr:unnamed protein product [Schistocephalus solidus]
MHSQEMVIQATLDASGGTKPLSLTDFQQKNSYNSATEELKPQSKDADGSDGGSQKSAKKHKRVHPNFEEVPATTLPSDYVTNVTVEIQSDTSNMRVNQNETEDREVSNDACALKYCDIDFVGESEKDLMNFANEEYHENRPLLPATSIQALERMNEENAKAFQAGGCEAYCDIDFTGRASVSREVGEGFANDGLAAILNSQRKHAATPIFPHEDMYERTDSPLCTAEIKVENLQVRLDENGFPTFSLLTPGDPGDGISEKSITLNAKLTTSEAFAKTFSASVSPVLSGLLNNQPLNFSIGGVGSGLSSPEYTSSKVQCHLDIDGRLSPEAGGNEAQSSPKAARTHRKIEDPPPIGVRRSPSELEATTWCQPQKGGWACFPMFKRK